MFAFLLWPQDCTFQLCDINSHPSLIFQLIKISEWQHNVFEDYDIFQNICSTSAISAFWLSFLRQMIILISWKSSKLLSRFVFHISFHVLAFLRDLIITNQLIIMSIVRVCDQVRRLQSPKNHQNLICITSHITNLLIMMPIIRVSDQVRHLHCILILKSI